MIRSALVYAAAGAVMLIFGASANAAAIFSPAPTQSGGTLLDFEGFTSGQNADVLFAASGVTFSGAVANTRIWDPPFPPGGQVASSGTGVFGPSAPESNPVTMTFASPESFVEFFFADTLTFAGTSYTFTAFGSGGVFLENLVVPNASLGAPFYTGFVRGAADIVSIEISPSEVGENWSVDDLRFGSSVPEPASLALLGLGLSGLGFARRRGRSR